MNVAHSEPVEEPKAAAPVLREARRLEWRYAVVLGAIAVLGRILLLPILPHSVPGIHDEFSYLLGAETFALGKLSNPIHPHAKFFQTFHVLSSPRYMSKYPPGQAAFLALGILLG